ncbi:hypothetical protein, partial [Brevibacterium metallidurans]|uniref:hypothetical protein n=1 Tax=Brevibacterium metallidurans TaxID=1482676 RepID=UPI0030DC23DE
MGVEVPGQPKPGGLLIARARIGRSALCVRLGVSHSRTERNWSTMTITPGYTVDEIRDFVYQYEKIP